MHNPKSQREAVALYGQKEGMRIWTEVVVKRLKDCLSKASF
jgi:hypothetical protein